MQRLTRTKSFLLNSLIFILFAQVSHHAVSEEKIIEPVDKVSMGREPIGIEAGYVYTKGTYGEMVESTTHIKSLTLFWTAFDIDFQLSTAHLERTAPAGTIIARVKKRVTVTPRVVSTSGAGDIILSANKEIFTDPATAIAVNASGEIKIAAADSSKGLGTGKNDYAIGFSASYPLETALISGGAKYSVLGNPGRIKVNDIVEDIHFKNVWSGYLALSTELTSKNSASLSLNVAQPSGSGTSYYQTVELATSYRFGGSGSLRIFALKGTNQNSPDWSAGVLLSGSF
ncbi:hypothetical protein LPB67_09430 [Undibacterium sp. Jales W-56]|uniref:hypothetical protein n=1 Tax=Undibacterium sp. Jales W-56 TaxID=2897325 RepID=UPI0021D1348D|nr:hypothetical protein [Undibacterium sp. Jales W-56]MCU6433986.1 hypothetical protein [Undibacterium sp. Jales W-56]